MMTRPRQPRLPLTEAGPTMVPLDKGQITVALAGGDALGEDQTIVDLAAGLVSQLRAKHRRGPRCKPEEAKAAAQFATYEAEHGTKAARRRFPGINDETAAKYRRIAKITRYPGR
jgi:hypothetical protein